MLPAEDAAAAMGIGTDSELLFRENRELKTQLSLMWESMKALESRFN